MDGRMNGWVKTPLHRGVDGPRKIAAKNFEHYFAGGSNQAPTHPIRGHPFLPLAGPSEQRTVFILLFSVRCFFFGVDTKNAPPGRAGRLKNMRKLVFQDGKVVLADAAFGAFPIVGNIFEGGTGGNAAIGVAHFGVVDPSAYIAYIFFHFALLC